MTVPHERMRSIGWGRELLAALQLDASIAEEIQQEAAHLEATYPTVEELLHLLKNPDGDLTSAAAQAIEEARVLFETVRQLGLGCDATQRHLLFTMRHFPLRGWSAQAMEASRRGRLDQWLAPDPGW